MKKSTILFIAILALSLIAISVAQSNQISLKTINDCKTVEWETEEPVYGTCQYETEETMCEDEPINESCTVETVYHDYECVTGTKTVEHSEKVCTPKAFEITKETADVVTETGRITFEEWGECSYETGDIDITVICDSQYDGNNDGICQSGESCAKFVVTQDKVERYLKNSQDEFTKEDDSFFLEKLDYEVISK
ncbi:MAG: hypothetical protein U9O94_00900 [Nanoarchaeota archaeon]|nr:hypothetical protein [Nanoarchaeota archaeon]